VDVRLASASHRVGVRFLRGGLVAVAGLLVSSQLGVVTRGTPALEPLVALVRVAIPLAAFALGGAVGGAALSRGRRGVVACAASFLLTGLALSLAAAPLRGLTGFEDPLIVLSFAAGTTGAAFGLGGVLLALLLERRLWVPIAGGFLAGGAAGGILAVLPAFLGPPLAGWPADVLLFVRLGCSLAGWLGPFAVAGAVAGRVLDRTDN
jgi:hypothetical protein